RNYQLKNTDKDEAGAEKIFKEILNLISEFIYNFPRIKYYKDEDVCSEFYLYCLDYISDILIKFDINGRASFQTWFAVVLFNLWRNFIKSSSYKEMRKKKITTKSIEDLNMIDRYKFLYETVVKNSDDENDGIYVNNKEVKSLHNCFKKMPKKVRVVFKAHFFELFTSKDIDDAVQAFQLDFMQTLRKYEMIVSRTREQYRDISQTIDELNKTVYELNSVKIEKKSIENDKTKEEEYSNKIKRLEKFKAKKIDKLKRKYIKLLPKEIADFFNTNANYIYNLLHRGKNYVKDYFNES
ncbi:MAG: RNA polymerase sigma factor, partial [Spirochaetota bacterium]